MHNLTNSLRAMKTISNRSSSTLQINLFNEILLHKRLDHMNILNIYEFFVSNNNYYIISEICNNGKLSELIETQDHFTEEQAGYIIYQILLAIKHCHFSNYVHCDLKLECILIKSIRNNLYHNIRLCNFRSAKICKNSNLKIPLPISFYTAPEILKENFNEKADIWSIGIILYILLMKLPPYNGTDYDLFKKIKSYSFNPQELILAHYKLSNNVKDLISKLLEVQPENRFSAEQALNHQWFKDLKIKEKLYPESNIRLNEKIDNIIIKTKNNELKKLQRIAISLIINNSPITNDLLDLNETFQTIDKDLDGKVNKIEFLQGYEILEKKNYFRDDVSFRKNVLKEIQDYIYETIDYEEFVCILIDKDNLIKNENSFKFSFISFDKDNSNNIILEDFKDFFRIDNFNILNSIKHERSSISISTNESSITSIISLDKIETENMPYDVFTKVMQIFISRQ